MVIEILSVGAQNIPAGKKITPRGIEIISGNVQNVPVGIHIKPNEYRNHITRCMYRLYAQVKTVFQSTNSMQINTIYL